MSRRSISRLPYVSKLKESRSRTPSEAQAPQFRRPRFHLSTCRVIPCSHLVIYAKISYAPSCHRANFPRAGLCSIPLLSLPLMNCQRRTGLTYFPAFLSLKSIEVQVYGRQSTWTRIKCTTQFWSLYNCVPNCANWIIVNSTISVITGSELSS